VSNIVIRSRLLGSPSTAVDASDVDGGLTPDNQRARSERRQCHPLLTDWKWSYRGRRKSVRRNTDNHRTHAILDWYHPSLFFFIVVTYVLSGIDAILTLTLLELGVAEEANPFMHMLLAKNIHLFAGVKALVTGLGLVCLAAYSNRCLFTRLRVDRLIYLLFAVYALLVVYEVSLLRVAEAVRWLGHS